MTGKSEDKVSTADTLRYLKRALSPQGNAPVVRIGFLLAGVTSNCQYYNKSFIDSCVDEIEKLLVKSAALGEEANPLEVLAINLLLESAWVDSFAALREATTNQKRLEARISENQEKL